MKKKFDLVVIGGGINGAGIVREAAAQGYKVYICDAGDFGAGTSSASTKLIHGGLRYLEHYKFKLVRDALKEREVLWKMAPHIIRPMRFILPHHTGLRPAWMLRLGLLIYDNLGGRKLLPKTKKVNLTKHQTGKPLKPEFKVAFEYSDCWVDDARLVILNLKDAKKMGAEIRSRTEVVSAQKKSGGWEVVTKQKNTGEEEKINASVVVNAAGPWVDNVLQKVFGLNQSQNIRLVRGSHIVIRRRFEHDKAYIFQNDDERIIFVIPYEDEFALIGTTDVEHKDIDKKIEIDKGEIKYLCETASKYLRVPVAEDDIVWTYSGVRPLYDDGASKAQEATREYIIKAQENLGDGSLLNIFGGKITTFRKLTQAVMPMIQEQIGEREAFGEVPEFYDGGEFGVGELDELRKKLAQEYPFVEEEVMKRMARQYGTEVRTVLGGAKDVGDLGKHFGCGLYEAEVNYLREYEWAQTAEDILWRRTKLGLKITQEETKNLEKFLVGG